MEANIADLQTLFEGKPVSYRIPQFQRPYAWKENEQWIPLLEDVLKVADASMKRDVKGKVRPHFMGAIVLQSREGSSSEVDKRLVVDGQQRLTTLQLLIRAAQASFQSLNDLERVARLEKLTLNDEQYWGGDSDNEMKIRQSNRNDQKAFQEAIRNGKGHEYNQSPSINKAYGYFKDAISEWLNADMASRSSKSEALEETLSKYLHIAAIDLDPEEKPHIIFETLNARGEPLMQSDLIKNTVMYEAGVIDDAQKARDLWGMFEDEWWRKNSAERRVVRSHIDSFLWHWIIMKTKKWVSSERVASEFRDYLESNRQDASSYVETVTNDIKVAGKAYQDLENFIFPNTEDFMKRMKTLEVGTMMPVLIWLCTQKLSPQRFKRSLSALESYLVRRMLCGVPSTGLTHLCRQMLERIETDWAETVDVDETIINYLGSQTVESRIWPNDRMLKESLTERPMRGNASRRKMVMESVELFLRSDKAEGIGPTDNLTIEHILPQKWNRHWPILSVFPDNESRLDAESIRNKAVKSIGNLTLVSGKLNASLSNAPWNEKRGTLAEHSTLFLNKNLLSNAPDVWDEEAIENRAHELAQAAIKVWPHADGI